MRSRKSYAEIEGFRDANLLDGAVLTNVIYNLYNNIIDKDISEMDLADQIEDQRRQYLQYIGPAFRTIVAFNGNSAFPHHRPTSVSVGRSELSVLLIDAGAHFESGSTDITRTWMFKELEGFCEDYAMVLRANMKFQKSVFRSGASGFQLDTFARQILWANGRDYEHGTGHSIGHLLHVHELPYRITKFSGAEKFDIDMIVSNEPGLYVSGAYGIRIENNLLTKNGVVGSDFVSFENITRVPVPVWKGCLNILSDAEIDHVRNLNRLALDEISPLLPSGVNSWVVDHFINFSAHLA